MARFRMTAVAFALVLVAAFALAEAWRPVAPSGGDLLEVQLASSLKAFADCGEFADTVRTEALKQVTPWGLNGGVGYGAGGDVMRDGAVALDASTGAEMAPGATSADAAAPTMPQAVAEEGSGKVEVSGTNVQEQGVDEPDLVKTDGRVLATVARGRLQLVDLREGTGRLAASVPLSNGWGHELLLHEGRLLITANVEEVVAGGDTPTSSDLAREGDAATSEMRIAPDAMPGAPGIGIVKPGTPKVELTLLDVSDPANPRTLGSVRLDGQAVSSRRVDGMVRLVLRSNPTPAMAVPQPGPNTDPAEMRDLEQEAIARNREIIQQSQAEDWLPSYSVRDADGDTTTEAPLVACDDVRHPEVFRGFGLLSVLAIPLTGENAGALVPTGSASVLGDGDVVYATPERLYVAMNRWEESGPQPLVDRAAETSVGAAEPAPGRPMPAPAPPKTTVDIHEFDTSDPARPVYTASANVPGQILNQWALSYHDGHLRVATTDGQFFEGQDSESAVYVLRREGDKLVRAGSVGGLGKGERIYAVRYFGDYGFVVTFRQTDPLYTLDLSDPAAPRVLGELKVSGFSAYLHPVGDGLLLGVGQDADEKDGRRLGVQVSLFDVSDLADPRRVANLTMEPDSSTDVEHEHRAFLWWPQARRAVLPYMQARWDEAAQREAGFFGALALQIDGDVREAGRLTHAVQGSLDPWWTMIRRAVVVGDTLYTVSERGLLASGVENLDERAFLEFDGPTPQQFVDQGVAEPLVD